MASGTTPSRNETLHGALLAKLIVACLVIKFPPFCNEEAVPWRTDAVRLVGCREGHGAPSTAASDAVSRSSGAAPAVVTPQLLHTHPATLRTLRDGPVLLSRICTWLVPQTLAVHEMH